MLGRGVRLEGLTALPDFKDREVIRVAFLLERFEADDSRVLPAVRYKFPHQADGFREIAAASDDVHMRHRIEAPARLCGEVRNSYQAYPGESGYSGRGKNSAHKRSIRRLVRKAWLVYWMAMVTPAWLLELKLSPGDSTEITRGTSAPEGAWLGIFTLT